MRAFALCCAALIAAQTPHLHAQGEGPAPLSLLDVPFISQSEALCGGAAAAMVLRYWGERGISADAFAHLVDRSAAGIRTDALIGDLRRRGWTAIGISGSEDALRSELSRGRPVLTLIEDRPSTFHYVVMLAWHARGIVFHDPARGPFVVMSTSEFVRKWRAAERWMAVVVPPDHPGETTAELAGRAAGPPPLETSECERAVAQAVRHAQSNELEAAERILAAAVGCPAAVRELAGVRVLQRRWAEAEDLVSAAIAAGDRDLYAWKVLATSRFVQNDRLGALEAWNRAGEPRLDLMRIDGLTRTRHRVVEGLLDVEPNELLTVGRFMRARRRLGDLPSVISAVLEYVPAPSGLAELRASVAERPIVPRGRLPLMALGLVAATTRELRMTTGSLVGGGEAVSVAWRFWPHRTRMGAGIEAPAPWGGLWSLDVFSERQPFTAPAVPRAERAGAYVGVSDWITGRLHWNVTAGIDEWKRAGARARVGGRVRFVSFNDRVDAGAGTDGWLGDGGFATADAGIRARSSTALRGVVFLGTAHIQIATETTPLDLWWAGDTGHARPTLMRAHPLLDQGQLRVDRLGRALAQASLEARRWWTLTGPVHAAAAVFSDIGRTARLREGPAFADVDIGMGARLAVTGMPGVFRVDLAKGLRDGASAVSVAYRP